MEFLHRFHTMLRYVVLAACCLLLPTGSMAACSNTWLNKVWFNEYFFGTGPFLEVYSTDKNFPAAWQNWSITIYGKNGSRTSFPLTNNTSFACTKTGSKTWLTTAVSSSLSGTEGLVVLRDNYSAVVDVFAFDNNQAPPAAWTSATSNYYPGLVAECSTLAQRLTDQATGTGSAAGTGALSATNPNLPNMLFAANQANKDYSRTPDGGTATAGNFWYETSSTGAGTTYTTCTSNNANLTKTVDVTTVAPGGTVHFILTIANPDSSAIASGTLIVADPLPSGLTYVAATSTVSGDSIVFNSGSNTVTWMPATLAGYARTVLTITATVPTTATIGTTYTNTATTSGTLLGNKQQSDTVAFSVVAPTTRSFFIQPNRQTSCLNTSSPFVASSSDPIVTITAKDQLNGSGNTLTGYTGTVTLGTSSSKNSAVWHKVPGAANGTLTLTASGATYSFAAADNGTAQLYLSDSKAETIDLTATDIATYSPATMDGVFSAITYAATCSTLPLVSVGNASITEGNSGTKTLSVPVSLSAASASSVTVNYATSNGTATAGSDYVATSGTLTIPAGAVSGSIPVTINGDTVYEHDETFTVTLSNPGNALLGVATGTMTILNDDAPPLWAAYYMDEQSWSGTATVMDSSGHGYHATAYAATPATVGSAPAYPAGVASPATCGYGIFNGGSNTYIALPSGLNGLPVSSLPGYTMMAWINPGAVNTGSRIVWGNNDSSSGWSLSLNNGVLTFSKSGVTFTYADGGAISGNAVTASASLAANTWYFVAVSVDTSAKSVTLYSYGNTVSGTAYGNRVTATYTGTWGTPTTGTTTIGGLSGGSGNFVGAIDEVRIYDGPLAQSDIESIRQTSRSCYVLDHIRLEHDGEGLTCSPESVYVRACADSNCNAEYVGAVSTTLSPALTSPNGWVGGRSISFSGGHTTVSLLDTVAGPVTLGAATTTPAPITPAGRCFKAGVETCSMNFVDTGFVFSTTNTTPFNQVLPNLVAGVASGNLYLAAVRTDTTTYACQAALTGTTTVSMAYQCLNPATCYAANLLTVNGGAGSTALQRNDGSAASITYASPGVSMSFDANGVAPFTLNYTDVGNIRLYATKTVNSKTLNGSSGGGGFVVKPYGFAFSNIKCSVVDAQHCGAGIVASGGFNPAATDATGSSFIQAGNDFSVTLAAVAAGGTATPSFGKESAAEGITLSSLLISPAGGSNSALAGTVTVPGTSFNTGVATVTGLNWGEVGIIQLRGDIADGDYLGAGNVSATSGNVGRFIPHHFALTSGAVTSACAAAGKVPFTYFGQDGFASTFTLTAQGKNNGTTANYVGSYAKLSLSDWNGLGFSAVTLPTGSVLTSSATAPSGTWSAGTALVTARHQIGRPTALTAPTTVTLKAMPVDSDGTTLLAVTDVNTVLLRYGRLRLANAFGTEQLPLPVFGQLEYYSVSGGVGTWLKNSDDSCTALTPAATSLTLSGGTGAGTTTLTFASPAASGSLNLSLSKPTGGTGSVDIGFPGTPAYLQIPNMPNNTSARATFGIQNTSNTRIIYRRERY